MTISFVPIDVRSSDKADFVEFLVGNAFPFHVHPHPSVEQISTAIDGGRYDGDDHAALWIDDDIRGRRGIVILEDLADAGPMFDLRCDWQSGTTTPVDWDDFPIVGLHRS